MNRQIIQYFKLIMSGKRDRPAHFEIDQKTLEYKQSTQAKRQSQVDSEQKIKQRKIYKIKMPGSVEDNQTQSKPKFTFFASATQEQSKPQSQQKVKLSLIQKQQPQANKKQIEAKITPDGGPKSSQAKQQPKQEKKNPFTNFSFSGLGNNIFGNSNNGIGIFTKASQGEGIFSKNNIFANKDSGLGKTDLGALKPSGTIFGTSQSVFNFSSGVPPVKKQGLKQQNDEEDDGDSAQLQQDQKQTADPTKSTGTYQYNSECTILFQKKLKKFKKNEGEALQNTEVLIQADTEKSKDWIIVRLTATKHPIVTGYLVKGKSEVKNLGNKDQNVVVSVLTIKDKQPQKSVLKMQFEKAEDGKSFKEAIEKILA